MENKAKKDGRKWLENMKKINAPFSDTLCSWNANLLILWAWVTDASGVEMLMSDSNKRFSTKNLFRGWRARISSAIEQLQQSATNLLEFPFNVRFGFVEVL